MPKALGSQASTRMPATYAGTLGVTIHVADGPRERSAAKEHRCLFCPQTKTWFVEVTDNASLTGWHRARLQPPTEYTLRITYEERERAKAAGCRWRPDLKKWVYASHGPPPGFVLKRVGQL